MGVGLIAMAGLGSILGAFLGLCFLGSYDADKDKPIGFVLWKGVLHAIAGGMAGAVLGGIAFFVIMLNM